MVTLAKIFFWLHTSLCVIYVAVIVRSFVDAVLGDRGILPSSVRIGEILVLSDDRVVSAMLYVILGLFLFYAEVYMYRIYTLAATLVT